MKTALSAVAVAAVLALAPLAGGTYAAADDSAQQQRSRFSPEDRAAFLDARIAKERAARFAAWRERREGGDAQAGDDPAAGVNPIDRLTRASEQLSARAADLQKLAAAAKPLYDSLDDGQKRRFAVLFHGSMGRGHWRHWRREG
jgi:zinc resistance-associated protein